MITEIPIEIIREIFFHLLLQHRNSNSILVPGGATCRFIDNNYSNNNNVGRRYNNSIKKPVRNGYNSHSNTCMCWQLDLLSVSMVCKSWYAIAVEIMQFYHQGSSNNISMPWISLLNYASHQRTYPFRSRLVKLLEESKVSNLIFHHLVRHLVIDFASFDTIRREKQKNNNIFFKRKIHNGNALRDVTELLRLCPNTEQLDIICDAGFANLLSQHSNGTNSIASNVSVLEKQQVWNSSKIKRLDLIGYNPIQRCPCCAGKDWDNYLIPLINCLLLDTLVLQNVLPSKQILSSLAEQRNLKRLVLHRSLITIPENQAIKDANGDLVRYGNKRRSSNSNNSNNSSNSSSEQQKQKRINSISIIPQKLWNQITSIAIFEDIEDAPTWPNRRYLYDLVEHVGPQLEEFTLQFGTKEENESSLIHLNIPLDDDLSVIDPMSILHKLQLKCNGSLRRVTLINVPENQPIR